MGMKTLLRTSLLALALFGSIAMARPSPATTPAPAPPTPSNSDALVAHAIVNINKGGVGAFILFTSLQNSTAVSGAVTIEGLPAGEYTYHIHEKPVPQNGDCAATGGHYDPYAKKGAKCTKDTLTDCEVGDLSGKFGKLNFTGDKSKSKDNNKDEVWINYEDPTIKLTKGADGIVGRSIVIHNPAGDRIACGNIVDSTMNFAQLFKQ